jgi:hypothetical protein
LPAARLKKRKREKEKKIWFYAHFSACKYLGYTGKALGYTRPNVGSSAASYGLSELYDFFLSSFTVFS